MRKANLVLNLAWTLGLVFFSLGCTTAGPGVSGNTDSNVTIYVINESPDINPVDIKVYIDGKLVIEKEINKFTQKLTHYKEQIDLTLNKGKHVIKAVTSKGGTNYEGSFEVTGNHWASLVFWYNDSETTKGAETEKQFRFNIQDKPILFR